MLDHGDTAPRFSATRGTTEHEPFDLEEELGDGPVVLAFFPAVFTPTCTTEMCEFDDRRDDFRAAGATVFGVSADSPFSQAVFRDEYGLDVELISDMAGDAIRAYDLEMDIAELGLYAIPQRAVFVIDETGSITYRWVADDPSTEPDYDEVLAAVRDA